MGRPAVQTKSHHHGDVRQQRSGWEVEQDDLPVYIKQLCHADQVTGHTIGGHTCATADAYVTLPGVVNSLTLKNPKNPRVRAAFTISMSCVWRWSESSNLSIWTRMALVSGRHLSRRCAGSCKRCIPRMARLYIGLLEVGLLSTWVRWRWDC